MNLQPASYKILYNSKNITKDISEHLLSLSYTDKVEGEADELEISLEDTDGLWQNEWYPDKGATIEAEITDGESTLPCGKFSLDENKFSGSKSGGDVVTFAGVSASVTKKMRTKRSTAHENKTLRQLAQTVADRHGLTIQGTIPDIKIGRVTQNRKGDLAFLSTISMQYGLVFNVRGTLLIFHKQTELEKKAHATSLDKTDVESFDFTDKIEDTYKDAKVQFHNPDTNETVESESQDEEGYDTLEIKEKAETKQQAELQASSQLRRKNTKIKTVAIQCAGNHLLVSGNNVELTGFGKLSGIYHITESKHSIEKGSSWKTNFDGKRVEEIPPAKHKPKKKVDTIKVFDLEGPGFRRATYKRIGKDEVLTFIE